MKQVIQYALLFMLILVPAAYFSILLIEYLGILIKHDIIVITIGNLTALFVMELRSRQNGLFYLWKSTASWHDKSVLIFSLNWFFACATLTYSDYIPSNFIWHFLGLALAASITFIVIYFFGSRELKQDMFKRQQK